MNMASDEKKEIKPFIRPYIYDPSLPEITVIATETVTVMPIQPPGKQESNAEHIAEMPEVSTDKQERDYEYNEVQEDSPEKLEYNPEQIAEMQEYVAEKQKISVTYSDKKVEDAQLQDYEFLECIAEMPLAFRTRNKKNELADILAPKYQANIESKKEIDNSATTFDNESFHARISERSRCLTNVTAEVKVIKKPKGKTEFIENAKSRKSYFSFHNEGNDNTKASRKKYFKVKKLLTTAKDLSTMNLPGKKSTIYEKLMEIYIKNTERQKKKYQDKSFIKCNYLEELVLEGNLNYFIIKLYPGRRFFLYIKNPSEVQYIYNGGCEETEFLESIDNKEIPTIIFDQIMLYPCKLIYSCHCILQIQKFAKQDIKAEPIFSTFVLLKPTSSIFYALNNKFLYDSAEKNEISNGVLINSIKQESNLLHKISGPLYLGVDPTALELIHHLKIYDNPFASASLKSSLAKKQATIPKQSFDVNHYEQMIWKNLKKQDLNQSSTKRSNSSVKEFCELKGSPSFSFADMKKDLHSLLVEREIKDIHDRSHLMILVEVFYFKTTRKKFNAKKGNEIEEVDKKYKLSVYQNIGLFYICLSPGEYIFNPRCCKPLLRVGSREMLDKYILKVAEIVSNRFTRNLLIQHKNVIETTEMQFFPRSDIHDEEYKIGSKELNKENFLSKSTGTNDEIEILEERMSTHKSYFNRQGDFESWRHQQYFQSDSESDKENENLDDQIDYKCSASQKRRPKQDAAPVKKKSNSTESSKMVIDQNDDVNVSDKTTKECQESLPPTSTNVSKTEQESIPKVPETTTGITAETGKAEDSCESVRLSNDSGKSHVTQKVSLKKTPEPDIESPGASFLTEAYTFQDDSVKSIFEAHPYEHGKRISLTSLTKNTGKKIEIFSSLKSEFKISKEDMHMQDEDDEKLGEDIKKYDGDMAQILKWISGCED